MLEPIIRPTPELIIDGDRRTIVAGSLRLNFAWEGDRWTHSLGLRHPGMSPDRVLATSFEADSSRDDPARVVSPAYQDLQFQEVGSTMRALLVGQSGPHHFSAVFDVVHELIQGVTGRDDEYPPYEVHVDIDIADRCRSPVEFLASTYVVEAQSGELKEAIPELISWDLEADFLNFVPEPPARASLAEAGRRATRVQAHATPESGKATHRLRYTWIWEQNLPL